jgi:ribosomal protein L37E
VTTPAPDPVGVDYIAGREPAWDETDGAIPCPKCGHVGTYTYLDGKIECSGCGRPRKDLTRTEEGKIMAKKKTKQKAKGAAPAAKKKNGADKTDHEILLWQGGAERRRFTQELPVRIGDAEVATLADALAKTVREREALREKRREAMAGFRERENDIADREKRLAESVEKHTELRQVECLEILARSGEVRVVRLDTGEEIEMRQATADDLQEPLGLDDDDDDTGDPEDDDGADDERGAQEEAAHG